METNKIHELISELDGLYQDIRKGEPTGERVKKLRELHKDIGEISAIVQEKLKELLSMGLETPNPFTITNKIVEIQAYLEPEVNHSITETADGRLFIGGDLKEQIEWAVSCGYVSDARQYLDYATVVFKWCLVMARTGRQIIGYDAPTNTYKELSTPPFDKARKDK